MDDLEPIGKERPSLLELGHFWRYNGGTYCFRPSCEGCSRDSMCQREDTVIKLGPGINPRRAFIAPPGWKVVSIDYSGVELRVAAQLSGEPNFIKAFQAGLDLHNEIAKLCFKTDKPTKGERKQAKCANFGNLYLGTAATLSRQSDLTLTQAAFVWNAWWNNLPTYKRFCEKQFEEGVKNKAIYTFMGRKRSLVDMIERAEREEKTGTKGKGKSGWGFVKRTCVNTPTQGSSADLIKLAMVHFHNWWIKEQLCDKIKLILTVHDELVFYIKDDQYLYKTCRDIQHVMTPDLSEYGWKVPLTTDCEIGDNWALLTKLDELDPKEKGSKKDILDPSKVRTLPDYVIIVVNTLLTDNNKRALELALLKASNSSDPNSSFPVVKVPVKIKIESKVFSPSNSQGLKLKVNEFLLRKLVKDIPGLEVEDAYDSIPSSNETKPPSAVI